MPNNSEIICPHCQVKGKVTATPFKKKGRLTATRLLGTAVTLGGSTVVTGVRKGSRAYKMSCGNCGMRWEVV